MAEWRCINCGDCCKLYSVVIDAGEWVQIAKNYGMEQTASGLDKLFIKRAGNGSCVFLCSLAGTYRCGLQHMKPKACQLWPFKVLNTPKYGLANEAAYPFGQNKLFVYVDSMCNGTRHGIPTWEFASQTLKEFVEIALGVRSVQLRTTGSIGLSGTWPQVNGLGVRRLF